MYIKLKEVTFWWDRVCLCVGENYSNQFIFRNFPTEFHGSHADCLAGDQAPCLRGPGGGMTSHTVLRALNFFLKSRMLETYWGGF